MGCKSLFKTKVAGKTVTTEDIGALDKSSHNTLSSDPCSLKVLLASVEIALKSKLSVRLFMAIKLFAVYFKTSLLAKN